MMSGVGIVFPSACMLQQTNASRRLIGEMILTMKDVQEPDRENYHNYLYIQESELCRQSKSNPPPKMISPDRKISWSDF